MDTIKKILQVVLLLLLAVSGIWLLLKFWPKAEPLWQKLQLLVSNPSAANDAQEAQELLTALKQILKR